MRIRSLFGIVQSVKVSQTLEGERNPYLECGIDGLITMSGSGKTSLGGLMYGMGGLASEGANDLIDKVKIISNLLHKSKIPRIARIDIEKRDLDLKCICLTPTTESDFYHRNFSRIVWSKRRTETFRERNPVWQDYIYAMTFYALVLVSRNPRIKICGITRLTIRGFGADNQVDAITNFANRYQA